MYRRNVDRNLRELERAAAQGDPDAAHQLEHMRFRLGMSLKNIDQDILLRRVEQWFNILVDIEYFLMEVWNWHPNVLPYPPKTRVDKWSRKITIALGSEPVDTSALSAVAYQINSFEEELSDYFVDDLDFTEIVLNDQTLSEIWEDGIGIITHHLYGAIRVYDPDHDSPLAWESLARDNYTHQDDMADIAAELRHKGDRGRLLRRGPSFMVAISPRFREEIRLEYIGDWKHSEEDDNLSIYQGSWREHPFEVRELLTNQWHATAGDESDSLIDVGELGERWQDATKLIGEWVDKWIMSNLSWLSCDSCRKSKIHNDQNCRACNAVEIYSIEREFSEHLCYLCLYHSSGEDLTQMCSSCASICAKCGGVVCKDNYHATSCKECGIILCDDFDCSIRCGGCDSSLCWEHRKDGTHGSLCFECEAESKNT